MSSPQEKIYDWSRSDERVRELGFHSFRAWCLHHEFSDKTAMALRSNRITWGFGPKVTAILTQALQDGLVVEVSEAA